MSNVDETEPISVPERRRRVDPWKIIACVSTAVSVATIATLVWTVDKVSDDPTPAERTSVAAGVTPAAAPPPPPPQPAAPAPITMTAAPSEPVAPRSNSINWDRPLNQYFPMAATAPARNPDGAPPPPQGGMPVWPFAGPAALPPINLTPNVMVNPGFSIDAIIGAVTGTAGWVGGGTLNLIGDAIVASAMNNQRPTDPLAALTRIPPPQLPRELDITRIPPPQWPRELDVTKIPPPQWPRELDITKIPPPRPPLIHWDRIIPHF
ncbi:hypothetical protein [Mycobacterium sp. 236(2023)]|uniref:hypothetical protein n=1 Tax=Mycobacterium sp. 236(2023) TaxID=3038163 RepID=UPI002414D565|nr:hypothetical protein [Mycobacterium sp. 236(2023)]MDG4663911.1 hypothetical protein [Mycobacterium sp. 236(2023)]